jgi:adenylate cyclase
MLLGAVSPHRELAVKKNMASTLRRFRLGKALVCAGIGLTGAMIVLLLRDAGVLQSAELYAYDKFVRLRAPNAPLGNEKIVLVEINEPDIEEYNHPLQDPELADLLNKIESQQPAVIGLDLYRDLPEPRHDRQGLEVLDSALKTYDNIICAFKFGDADHPFEIPPPAVLKSRVDDRIGFNDFNFDNKSGVRRACIYFGDAKGVTYTSFALQLAIEGGGVNPSDAGNGLIGFGRAPVYKFTRDTGGYSNADDGGYQFLLDFNGPRTFTSYSIDDVYKNRIPGNAFTGKIVLIGEAASSVKDSIMTPLRDDEPGVELHATVVDQLIRMQNGARAPRAWGGTAQMLWLIFWCAIAAGIGYHCRAPVAFITASIVMALVLVYSCWWEFLRGCWIPLIPPLAGSLPVTAIVVCYMGHLEKKDRGTLMKILGITVSKGVAQALWEERDTFMRAQGLISRRLTATVLFTDLQNFSTVSERMEPEELLVWINEYMEMLVRHVERYGGMVNKYMGDSIMAVFGAPVRRTLPEEIKRDALNSVRCALAMGKALDQLNSERREQGRFTTNMRVGIYTGPVVSGSIGSCERLEFTVLGDTVNTASRLESFDKSLFADQTCRILLGETTRELVEDHFRLKFVDMIELKGQHEKTGIYYVPRDENNEEGGIDGRAALSGDVQWADKLAGGHSAAPADLPSAGAA